MIFFLYLSIPAGIQSSGDEQALNKLAKKCVSIAQGHT
jgi:hypothetical protein